MLRSRFRRRLPMTSSPPFPTRTSLHVTLAALALACAGFLWARATSAQQDAQPIQAGRGSAPEVDVTRVDAPPSAGVGDWRVYRDPQTGEFVEPAESPGAAAKGPAGVQGAPSLVQRPSSARGGGVLVDLQGRFESSARAARDASGKTAVDCFTGADSKDAADGRAR